MATVKVTPEMVEADMAIIDWARIDALTSEDIHAAVASDPDAVPIQTEAQMIGGSVRVIRKRLGLTQEGFAVRYGVPLDVLREWEKGAALPEAATLAYLRAIANQPEAVAAAYAAE